MVRAEFTERGLAEVAIIADDEEEQKAGIRLYERLRPGLLELDKILRETATTGDGEGRA